MSVILKPNTKLSGVAANARTELGNEQEKYINYEYINIKIIYICFIKIEI